LYIYIYIVSTGTPEIESRWGARLSTPDQPSPGPNPASYTMGSGSFPGVKRQIRDVNHPLHPAQRLKKSRDIIILLLWDFIARYRVNFSLYLYCSSASNYTQCDSATLETGYKKINAEKNL